MARTTAGPVLGRAQDGVCTFKSIPYGASTAGLRRFRPPISPAPWADVLPATTEHSVAPQRDPRPQPPPPPPNEFAGIMSDRVDLPESEDCLRLHVWTPALRDGGRRPVMVWLHGGGFVAGSASGAWQDGVNLARRGDIVMVSPNHRLNVLGYTYLDQLAGDDFAGSSNAGMLDLVLALEWVRDNIEEFGGDPDNVTIFGQSGGGQKVSNLMAMPAARGLFHKAIIQSGPAPKALEPDYANGMAEQLFDRLGLGPGDVSALQDTPLEDIMAAYHHVYQANGGAGVMGVVQGFVPAVDGVVLPRHPFAEGAPEISADIPLLIGCTQTEMSLYTLLSDPAAESMSPDALLERAARLFGSGADRVVEAYRAHHPAASPWELHTLISADWPTRVYSIQIADHQTARAPVYMYRIDWRTPVLDGRLFSPHAIEIALVLDNVDAAASFNGGGPEAHALGRRMSDAWLAFARTGDPNTSALPAWPAYQAPRRPTMLFDDDPMVADDPDGADRAVIQEVTGVR